MSEQTVFVRGRLGPRGVERFKRLFAWLYWLGARPATRGQAGVPAGSFIAATNHLSRFDPPLIFATLPQRKVTIFVANSYRRNRFFKWILELIDVIWVARGTTSPSTMKAAIQALREPGTVLGLAPEGTRSLTGALQPGKTGVAFLALSAGVPVVPVAITGTEKLAHALPRLRRVPLTITYGEPVWLGTPGQRERADQARLEAATTEIMCRIAALLPPEYRGVYADHPRLRELLGEVEAKE